MRQGKALWRHIGAECASQHVERRAFAATAGAHKGKQAAPCHIQLLYAQAKALVAGARFANIAQAKNHFRHYYSQLCSGPQAFAVSILGTVLWLFNILSPA